MDTQAIKYKLEIILNVPVMTRSELFLNETNVNGICTTIALSRKTSLKYKKRIFIHTNVILVWLKY